MALAAVLIPAFLQLAAAQVPPGQIGIVVMHGKGGSPSRLVSGLAASLQHGGYLVANLEMPWSGRRNYDVDVSAAEREVESALEALRGKGAKKVFIAGHSQGGVFALYFASKHAVDGVIAIAPGGSVGSKVFSQKVGESVAQARELVAAGKGAEQTRLMDYEGSRGTYPVVTTPKAYLSWFDPKGAMNVMMSARAMKPQTPVLHIAPTRDYPGLSRTKQQLFGAFPENPLTRLYEPDADHKGAPSASLDEIVRWTQEVAGR